LVGSVCIECGTIINNCKICTQASIGAALSCSECENEFYLSGPLTCSACSDGCKTCSSATTCSKCLTGYDLISNACTLIANTCILNCAVCANSPTPLCDRCLTNYYFDTVSLLCVPCTAQSNCLTC
jgi:hypothetical protein